MTRTDHPLSDQGPSPVKIVAYNKQYRVTLPKDLVNDKGWDAGTELRFVEDENGRIYIKEIHSRGGSQQ